MKVLPLKNISYCPKTTNVSKNSSENIQRNDFEFSLASANALKANVLSFGAKLKPIEGITRRDILAKQRELSSDFYGIYKTMQGVYKNYFGPCIEQISKYQKRVLSDYNNAPFVGLCMLECEGDKQIFTKYRPDYKAEYKAEFDQNGELTNIAVFNDYSMQTHSIEFQGDDVFIFFEENSSAGFKRHNGVLEPRSYIEYGFNSKGEPFIKKRMIFDDDEKMHYEEATSKNSRGFKIDFEDFETFTYEELEEDHSGTISKGESIRAKEYNIKEWNLGYTKFRNGAFEQYPRIVIDDSFKVIEYDKGYTTNISGQVVKRGTYIKNEKGIPGPVLKWLGFKDEDK